MRALDLYKTNKISIISAVSHYNEATLPLCLNSIEQMKERFVDEYIISGKTPMCKSFNAALDFAYFRNADILFHTASDVIIEPFALKDLLNVMDLQNNYLSIGKGYDSIHGHNSSVGIWIWNMHIMGKKFRFRDLFKQDMDLCKRIENKTGKSRVYTPADLSLGYHHPIWSAKELYMKYRYSLPKYSKKHQIEKMMNFLYNGLKLNPDNKVLLAGLRGSEVAKKFGKLPGSKNNSLIYKEFLEQTSDIKIDGTEYYILHKRFRDYAKKVFNTDYNCIAIDD